MKPAVTFSFLLSIAGLQAQIFPVASISVTGVDPAVGSGTVQTFSVTVTDNNGFADLSVVDVIVNSVLDGTRACYFAVVPASSTSGYVYLVDDAGDGGYVAGSPMPVPSGSSLQNSQCTIVGTDSSVAGNGNTLSVRVAVMFAPGFAGNNVVYVAARDNTQNTGWQAMGTWNVPGAAPTGPAVGGMTPGRSVAPSSGQTYSFAFTDTNGYTDLAVLDIIANSVLNGGSACYIAFVPVSATDGYVYLVDDAGDGGYAPGSPILLSSGGAVQNSQCSINTTGSSALGSGNGLTLNLAITFLPGFAGNRAFYLAARNNTSSSGWQPVGSVNVPVQCNSCGRTAP
jgi:hypothetical protein